MAELFPFSSRTAERLAGMPGPGGTHRWLAQAACGVRHALMPEEIWEWLRRCCDLHVSHRMVSDGEIWSAVWMACGLSRERADGRRGTGARGVGWPAVNPEAVARVLAEVEPLFDGESSTGLGPRDVLPGLFRAGELVCVGACSERAVVLPLESAVAGAERMQFVCVNPMRAALGVNKEGRPSARCQSNVAVRRHLVAEFDDATLGKRAQAQLATALGRAAPLVLAVDSGGKSVHAWYAVEGWEWRDQARFFASACALGADATRWDSCGWVRMPGGLRMRPDGGRVRQRVLYWAGQAGAAGASGAGGGA